MSLLVRFFASPRRGISASGEKIGLVVGLKYFRTSFVDLLVLSCKLHKDDQDHSAGLANNSLHSGILSSSQMLHQSPKLQHPADQPLVNKHNFKHLKYNQEN
jgi:hypothetical protein